MVQPEEVEKLICRQTLLAKYDDHVHVVLHDVDEVRPDVDVVQPNGAVAIAVLLHAAAAKQALFAEACVLLQLRVRTEIVVFGTLANTKTDVVFGFDVVRMFVPEFARALPCRYQESRGLFTPSVLPLTVIAPVIKE